MHLLFRPHFIKKFAELCVDIMPFAQPGIGKKPFMAGTAKFVGGKLLGLIVIPGPQLEVTEKIGMFVAEFQVRGVGGLLPVEGTFARVLYT